MIELEGLWKVLSECLSLLSRMSDAHAVLVLQPAVEAFFIVHAGEWNRMVVVGGEKWGCAL